MANVTNNNTYDAAAPSKSESERYHRDYYRSHELFESGSWLEKPNSHIMALARALSDRKEVRVLDLGSGVGRNSIPMAQAFPAFTFDCVDFVDVAIEKLKSNAERYGVAQAIRPIHEDASRYQIDPHHYDLVMAMSVLEYAAPLEGFEAILRQIQQGTKVGGYNCLSITTDLSEIEVATGKILDPLIATELTSDQCEKLLRQMYKDWEVCHFDSSSFSQILMRTETEVSWSARYCLFIGKRSM